MEACQHVYLPLKAVDFLLKCIYMLCITLKAYNPCFLTQLSPFAFLMEVHSLVCEVRTDSVYQMQSSEG
jgi:hypothetical protein